MITEVDPDTPEILFMTSLKQMLRSVGIHKMYEAMDYFKLMEEAVIRECFNRQNPNNTEKYKEHRSRQAFIKIFQSRYRLTYDIDYEAKISDKDSRNIGLIVKKLEENDIPIDIYLEWFFDEYLKKRNFTVENISFPCSSTVYQSFKLNNRSMMDEIKNKKLEERARIELFEKGKEIIRYSKLVSDSEMKNLALDVVELVKKFSNKDMGFDAFRDQMNDMARRCSDFKARKMNINQQSGEPQ